MSADKVYDALPHLRGLSNTVLAGSGIVVRKETPHRCEMPSTVPDFRVGDEFYCSCGSRYDLRDRQQYEGGPCWVRVP